MKFDDSFMRAALGALITLGFFAVVFVVIFVPVNPSVKDVVLVLLGALIASFKEVTGFFFGSSSGSTKKDETIANQLPPASPPVTDTPQVVKIDTSAAPVAVTEVVPKE